MIENAFSDKEKECRKIVKTEKINIFPKADFLWTATFNYNQSHKLCL